MSKTIGIDPGTTEGAIIVWDNDNNKIADHKMGPNNELLDMLRNWPEQDTVVNCETIMSYGQRVGEETFETCFFIGRVQEICHSKGLTFNPIRRKDALMVHCASGKATDADMRRAMIDYVGEPGNKKNPGPTYGISAHEWSALAIALYNIVKSNYEQRIADLKAARELNKQER